MVNKEETQQDQRGGGRERERGDGGRERTRGTGEKGTEYSEVWEKKRTNGETEGNI